MSLSTKIDMMNDDMGNLVARYIFAVEFNHSILFDGFALLASISMLAMKIEL